MVVPFAVLGLLTAFLGMCHGQAIIPSELRDTGKCEGDEIYVGDGVTDWIVKMPTPNNNDQVNPEDLLLPNPENKNFLFSQKNTITIGVEMDANPSDLRILEISLDSKFAEKVEFLNVGETKNMIGDLDGDGTADWNQATWTFPTPGPLVNEMQIKISGSSAEFRIRNFFVRACVPVEWCSWEQWDACTVSCGKGQQSRSRVCSCPKGNPDPDRFKCKGQPTSLTECEGPCCPEPPKWGKWGDWSPCSPTCGTESSRSRSRKCIDSDCPDGSKCGGSNTQTEACPVECCQLPPSWSPWKQWSSCDPTCGDFSSRERSRTCEPSSCPDGTDCPGAKKQTDECEVDCCQAPPEWGDWGNWGECSESCGDISVRERKRTCLNAECSDGTDCPGNGKETEDCDVPCCPEPPSWTKWAEWSSCDPTCGNSSSRFRTRKCEPHACPDGTDCPGPKRQTDDCVVDCCRVPPEWGPWGAWSGCDPTCGDFSVKERERECSLDACDDGTGCPGKKKQTMECDVDCCREPPSWAPWNTWTGCEPTCGNFSMKERTRKCVDAACPDGTDCPGPKKSSEECDVDCCRQPPTWSPWQRWTSCEPTCGEGSTRERSRKCDRDICDDGTDCDGKKKQVDDCDVDCCRKPPKLTPWGQWSSCSKTCGDGSTRKRERNCRDDACPDGTNCDGPLMQTEECDVDCCRIPPTWGPWQAWGECTATCDSASRMRSRKCQEDADCPELGGKCIGAKQQSEDCEVPCCPIEPQWTKWSQWSDCSVTCGTGEESRSRRCKPDAECPSGNPCPGPKDQSRACDKECCQWILDFEQHRNLFDIQIEKFKEGSLVGSVDGEDVLDGSGTNLLLLENSEGKDFIQIDFAWPISIIEIGFKVMFATEATVTATPGVWDETKPADPFDWAELVFKAPGGQLDKQESLTIEFGYESGEIAVKKLYMIICVHEDFTTTPAPPPTPAPTPPPGDDCECRLRGDPIVENCNFNLWFLGVGTFILSDSDLQDCFYLVSIENVQMGQMVVTESMHLETPDGKLWIFRDHTVSVDGGPRGDPPINLSWVTVTVNAKGFVHAKLTSCGVEIQFWGENKATRGLVHIPADIVPDSSGLCNEDP